MDLRSRARKTRNSNISKTRARLTSCGRNRVRVADPQYDEPATIPAYTKSHYLSAYHPMARNVGTVSHRNHTSPTNIDVVDPAIEWLSYQNLQTDYRTHKRNLARMIDPIAWQAVTNMDISRFVQPTNSPSQISTEKTSRESWFPARSPPEDLGYSLRNFLTVNPVRDPNVVFARIAIREGRTEAGHVPLMPQPRNMVAEWEVGESSGTCGDH